MRASDGVYVMTLLKNKNGVTKNSVVSKEGYTNFIKPANKKVALERAANVMGGLMMML